MSYKILSSESQVDLQNLVLSYIELGYEPIGGITIKRQAYNPDILIQAVFKRGSDEEL